MIKREIMDSVSLEERANILAEALPYILKYHDIL